MIEPLHESKPMPFATGVDILDIRVHLTPVPELVDLMLAEPGLAEFLFSHFVWAWVDGHLSAHR
jgi:hypothetical protein